MATTVIPLHPVDSFWKLHIKDRVFVTKPHNLEELLQEIINVKSSITPKMLEKIRVEFQNTLYYCEEVQSSNFEH